MTRRASNGSLCSIRCLQDVRDDEFDRASFTSSSLRGCEAELACPSHVWAPWKSDPWIKHLAYCCSGAIVDLLTSVAVFVVIINITIHLRYCHQRCRLHVTITPFLCRSMSGKYERSTRPNKTCLPVIQDCSFCFCSRFVAGCCS